MILSSCALPFSISYATMEAQQQEAVLQLVYVLRETRPLICCSQDAAIHSCPNPLQKGFFLAQQTRYIFCCIQAAKFLFVVVSRTSLIKVSIQKKADQSVFTLSAFFVLLFICWFPTFVEIRKKINCFFAIFSPFFQWKSANFEWFSSNLPFFSRETVENPID